MNEAFKLAYFSFSQQNCFFRYAFTNQKIGKKRLFFGSKANKSGYILKDIFVHKLSLRLQIRKKCVNFVLKQPASATIMFNYFNFSVLVFTKNFDLFFKLIV